MKTDIIVDHVKCGDPRNCTQCMKACAPALFIMYSPDYESNDPINWRVDVAFTNQCTRCGDCVSVCPNNAITLK